MSEVLDLQTIPAALRHGVDEGSARIEDASLAVAQPTQQSYHDGWLLRYSPGKARRARSVNMLGAGVLSLPDKLHYCALFYARHALPCLFRVTPFSQPAGLDDALAAAGCAAYQDTRVMRVALSSARPVEAGHSHSVDAEQFAAAFAKLHGLDARKAQAERERYTRSVERSAYVAQYDGNEPIACGSVAIDGALAGIFGMVTAPSHRGRGIARTLIAALLERARGAGALTAYLQVEADNAPARRLYGGFGFEDCYAYWYRARPADLAHHEQTIRTAS